MKHASQETIQRARRLYVKEGFSPMHVAGKVNTQVENVRNWIKRNGWQAEREAYLKGEAVVDLDKIEAKPLVESKESKQNKAAILFTEKGYKVNEICKLLTISNTMVSNWIKQGKWEEKREANRLKADDFDVCTLETKMKKEPVSNAILRAEILYTQKGYEASEIARLLHISASIVGTWIENNNWFAERNSYILNELQKLEGFARRSINDSMVTKQAKAKYLLLVKGFSQKEIANHAGISEKTLSQWVKKWGWKDEEAKKYHLKGGFAGLMEGFVKFVEAAEPDRKKDVLKLWGKYLQTLEAEFNNS